MVYNITNITSATNLYTMTKAVNELTNGVFFSLLLAVIFIVILMAFPNTDFSKLLVVDSFVVSVIAFLGFVLGFISWGFLILPIIVLLGSVIYFRLYN